MAARRGQLGRPNPAQGMDEDATPGAGGEGGRRASEAAAAAHAPGPTPGETPVGSPAQRCWRIEDEAVERDAQADASAADVLRRRLASLIARALTADGLSKAQRGADV